MAATDHSLPSAQNSVFAVLEIATHELRELQSRHHELSRRIRSIRSAVNALRQLSTHPTAQSEGPLEHTQIQPASGHNGHRGSTSAVSPRFTSGGNEQLTRACRIALLETFDALSEEDIHARIVRRGSYHFADASSAKPAIVRELEAMAQRGEVLRMVTSCPTKWRRLQQETPSPL